MKNYKTIQYLIVGFNLMTVVMYLFPPVVKDSTNKFAVLLFLLLSCLFMFLGIRLGYKKVITRKKSLNQVITHRFLTFLLVFYTFTFLFKYGYLMGLSPFDVNGMINRVMLGMIDPAFGYMLSLNEGRSPVPWSIFFIISIVNDFFFLIFFCLWKKLRKVEKFAVIFFAIIDIFYWLGRGTNFGIITMLTNMLFAYLLNRKQTIVKRSKRIKSKIRIYATIGIAAALSIYVFSYLMIGRTGEGDAEKSMKNIEASQEIDYNSFAVSVLPANLIPTYYFVYSYCCQGYENLGRAMECDFHWCNFFGNNPRLMSLAALMLRYKAMDDSYMMELEEKYKVDSSAAWHSAYLWWANDVTIPGSLIIIFFLAYFCGCALAYSFRDKDILSMVMAVALCNMLLFTFANNTYLALMFYSFMFVFPYWAYTRVLK